MTITKAPNYWGSKYQTFQCNTHNDYISITRWMSENGVEHFLWGSGPYGYIFDVRKGIEWFLLRWS